MFFFKNGYFSMLHKFAIMQKQLCRQQHVTHESSLKKQLRFLLGIEPRTNRLRKNISTLIALHVETFIKHVIDNI